MGGKKVKSVEWLGALRTSQKNRILTGMGLLGVGGGNNKTVIDFQNVKEKKKVKNLNQRKSGTSTTPTLDPWY